jgi:hypothetical protein
MYITVFIALCLKQKLHNPYDCIIPKNIAKHLLIQQRDTYFGESHPIFGHPEVRENTLQPGAWSLWLEKSGFSWLETQ